MKIGWELTSEKGGNDHATRESRMELSQLTYRGRMKLVTLGEHPGKTCGIGRMTRKGNFASEMYFPIVTNPRLSVGRCIKNKGWIYGVGS